MTDIVEGCAAAWNRMAMDRELAEASKKLVAQSTEIARLRAALEAWNHAVRIDVLMEGPRYMGVSGAAGKRAWEMTRAALKEDGDEK